jgi:hypothetical protein
MVEPTLSPQNHHNHISQYFAYCLAPDRSTAMPIILKHTVSSCRNDSWICSELSSYPPVVIFFFESLGVNQSCSFGKQCSSPQGLLISKCQSLSYGSECLNRNKITSACFCPSFCPLSWRVPKLWWYCRGKPVPCQTVGESNYCSKPAWSQQLFVRRLGYLFFSFKVTCLRGSQPLKS